MYLLVIYGGASGSYYHTNMGKLTPQPGNANFMFSRHDDLRMFIRCAIHRAGAATDPDIGTVKRERLKQFRLG